MGELVVAGKKLAESIVKEKLAACVNRVPGIDTFIPISPQYPNES